MLSTSRRRHQGWRSPAAGSLVPGWPRSLRHERFRQRVVEGRIPLRGPRWEPDPAFSLDAHLRVVALTTPHGDAALQTLVGDLASTPLDFSRPLWDMHLIEGVGEGCALLVRLHHCIADGIALVRLMLTLTDGGNEQPGTPPDRTPHPRGGILDGVLATVADPGGALRTAWWSAGAALELARVTLMPPDPARCSRASWDGGSAPPGGPRSTFPG
jgi:diacylglycerol O-acyltransferase